MKLRTKATVDIYDANNFVSCLNLDTEKYDHIGITKQSLEAYMKAHILKGEQWYTLRKWSVNVGN